MKNQKKYSNEINGRRWTSIVLQICPLLLSSLTSILLPVAALPFLFPQSNPLCHWPILTLPLVYCRSTATTYLELSR
ncbi:hypothetical protein RHGRI_015249 [Rhododendron griersonianum]|uniref:Uncharacterized protein n=1 Tax=Rhododendron griersonianum TaxID=479676 RepID=A0AAV6KD36_9ERIC|nr:hypothetical protein RHGRI_015249 [Rhododendron griersonianum]